MAHPTQKEIAKHLLPHLALILIPLGMLLFGIPIAINLVRDFGGKLPWHCHQLMNTADFLRSNPTSIIILMALLYADFKVYVGLYSSKGENTAHRYAMIITGLLSVPCLYYLIVTGCFLAWLAEYNNM